MCIIYDMKKRALTKEEILHLAKLANLKLTEEEIEKLKRQLSETLDYVENLNSLDTSKTPPTDNVTGLNDVFFEDGGENTRGLNIDEVLKNAKRKKDNYFEVNKILDDFTT